MSNTPPKKSDENKRWRKPRRDRGSRISPEYHLIITEGSKTEPLYFEGLKKAVNQKYTGRIEIVGLGEGANTLSILDTAEKVQLRSGGKYRHIWIVYDKDDFPEDDFGDLPAGGKEVILVFTYQTADPDELLLDLIFIEMRSCAFLSVREFMIALPDPNAIMSRIVAHSSRKRKTACTILPRNGNLIAAAFS